ncbi:alpha/beta fold hydrolase [Pseudoalteromonas rhizosphaerae]|uniref:Alpha/beta fold hydrolase n=1 Tax=Pseudoalteromonas rhizosphaerae TaxID=2518973 RepID=A0ABW8KYS9_9GAMM
MRTIKIKSGITISYQDKGKKSAPVIIMIMGLGAQLTVWPDELYFGLVAKGFRVIRFDNRDTGLSSQLEQFGSPNLFKIWLNKRLPIKSRIPYTLDDMANDVLELMAELKIKKAHLVGASMGGMIAQIIAAKHKKKVLSLTSIMSSSSKPKLSASNLKLFLQLAKHRRAQASRDGAIHYNIRLNQLIGSPAYPQDELALRKQATLGVDRAHNPQGFNRQLAAITASDCRQHLMPKIKAPTLVIHGNLDPVIPVSAGKLTAVQIRKAKLRIVNGMGHNFPPALMSKMTKWISKHVKKAEQKRAQKKLKKAVSGKR